MTLLWDTPYSGRLRCDARRYTPQLAEFEGKQDLKRSSNSCPRSVQILAASTCKAGVLWYYIDHKACPHLWDSVLGGPCLPFFKSA
jgi:hypothetical protein